MAKACKVPTKGSDAGKYNFANTRPVTVLYRKKSYHSIVVPIVLAITARRSCAACSWCVSELSVLRDIVLPPERLNRAPTSSRGSRQNEVRQSADKCNLLRLRPCHHGQ